MWHAACEAGGTTRTVADDTARPEFQLWHCYDAGGPTLRLKVRYRDDEEVPDWRDGPDLADAVAEAAGAGWEVYDREPGAAPGEYAILHLMRGGPAGRPPP